MGKSLLEAWTSPAEPVERNRADPSGSDPNRRRPEQTATRTPPAHPPARTSLLLVLLAAKEALKLGGELVA